MQWICIRRWQKLGADVCISLAACSRLEVAVRSAFQGMSPFVIEVPSPSRTFKVPLVGVASVKR